MKKYALLTIIIAGLSLTSISQDFWQELDLPVPGMSVYSMVSDSDNRLFIGSDNVYYTDDQGINWTSGDNWPGHWVKCLAVNQSDHIFAGTFSNGMYRSVDGGASYTEINNGISFLNIWCIFIDLNDNLLIGTPGGLFKSTDNGDSWSVFGDLQEEVVALVLDEFGNLYAGTFDAGIYISGNMGQNFTAVNNGLPAGSQITAMIAVPDEGVFAGFFPEGVYHSENQGEVWATSNEGLPFGSDAGDSYSVDGFYFLLGLLIVIIYFFGAYVANFSKSGLILWMALSGGLPEEPSMSCINGNSNADIYIGTYEDGLFMNAVPVGIYQIPGATDEYSLGDIYPNPVVDQAYFNFSTPEKCQVQISIVNQVGQECIRIADREFEKGKYRIGFQMHELEAAVYYLKVSSKSYVRTLKCVKQ